MTKSGKMTPAELFYVENNPDGKTIHELASELDRTPKTIAKYYQTKIEKTSSEVVQAPPPPPKPESPMFQLMGRHKRNEKNVATVMTKAASELSDATRPERLKNKNKLDNVIHRPKG